MQTNKKSIPTTVQGHQEGTYVNPEKHSDMPVQETNLLFKANETSTPTTFGAPEKPGRILPLCKAKAHSICSAHSNRLPIRATRQHLTSRNYWGFLICIFLSLMWTFCKTKHITIGHSCIFIYIYLADVHVDVYCLVICNVFHFQKRKNSTHRKFLVGQQSFPASQQLISKKDKPHISGNSQNIPFSKLWSHLT